MSADAKQTANKVSNMINKEAEEIESHAKSAGKEYVASASLRSRGADTRL